MATTLIYYNKKHLYSYVQAGEFQTIQLITDIIVDAIYEEKHGVVGYQWRT